MPHFLHYGVLWFFEVVWVLAGASPKAIRMEGRMEGRQADGRAGRQAGRKQRLPSTPAAQAQGGDLRFWRRGRRQGGRVR